jgi:hypothetical protein
MTTIAVQSIDNLKVEPRQEVLSKYGATIFLKVDHAETWGSWVAPVKVENPFGLEEGICDALSQIKQYGVELSQAADEAIKIFTRKSTS